MRYEATLLTPLKAEPRAAAGLLIKPAGAGRRCPAVPTRAQAFAVAYIALVAVVFAADVVLLVASMRSASAVQSLVPGLVEKFSSGLVTGSYSVVPYSSGYPSGSVRGYATYISLVNPNPFTVDVVVLAYIPGYPGVYRVFDIYDPSQLQWYTGSPPPGVSVVQAPSWDPGLSLIHI